MITESEKIIQTHLDRMNRIIHLATIDFSRSEKRITQNYLQKAQKQLETSYGISSTPSNDLVEDSFEKISYYIDLTLRTFEKISSPILDENHRVKFIYMISETYETLGNYDAALTHYTKAKHLVNENNNLVLKGKIQYKMARIYGEMGNWVKAEKTMNEAIENLQNTRDFSGVALAKLEKAKIAYKKGEYATSENLFHSALEASEFINDVSNTATINNHLGIILRMQGKYEQGFQYFQRALIDFQSIQNKQGTADSLNNLGVVYLKNNDLRSAIGYFEKALEICQESGILPLMAFIYLNKAEFYSEVGDYPMATTACGKALEILIRLKNPIGIAKTNNLLGRIFWKCGDLVSAKSFYQESIQLYKEFGIPLGLANSYQEYADMLDEAGESGEAKKYSGYANKVLSNLDIIVKVEEERAADFLVE